MSSKKALIFDKYTSLSDNELSTHASETELIIVGAGRGSRLGFHLPKLLFPVGNETILDKLLKAFQGTFSKLIIVVSDHGYEPIDQYLKTKYSSIPVQLVVQKEPIGMADAVFTGLNAVTSENVMIVWGDQAGLGRETVRKALRAYYDHSACGDRFTLMTAMIESSYIHFERDSYNHIVSVKQRREGDQLPSVGETDCGFFVFSTRLLEYLKKFSSVGELTKELNFLPLMVYSQKVAFSITLRTVEPVELMGVNTVGDALKIEGAMGKREIGDE